MIRHHRIIPKTWICLSCIFLLSAFFSNYSTAQTFKYKSSEASEILQGSDFYSHTLPDTITVWSTDWDFIQSNLTHWGDSLKYKSNNTFVKFAINNYNPITLYQYSYNYTYKLTFTIYGFTNPLDTVSTFTVNSDTLTVSYYNTNNPYQDLNLKKYSNFYKAIIVITGIYDYQITGVTPADLSILAQQNFQVEGSIVTQRYDKANYGAGVTPLVTMPYPDVPDNYLSVFWNYAAGDTTAVRLTPVSYELEWTYVDDYTRDLTTGTVSNIPSTSLSYDFTNNCTRVWLDSNHYRIPLVYQSGYVIFRVRAVRPDSTLFEYPVYGDWSLTPDTGNIGALAAGDYYQITSPYQGDSLNWQYIVSFAEEGKFKHVLSFYDGLLKNRQSITRFNSDLQNVIVTQNIYDYEGHPCIKTLPAPVQSTSFSYLHDVALNSITGSPYQAAFFDTGGYATCPAIPVISPLATNALASIYYSSQNPDTGGVQHFVPDAQGYPLIQTTYQPGYNDRIIYQGGAGPALQIGNSNYITNYYVGSNQADLNRLFAGNIGWQSYYRMTVTDDPNQQLSMAIRDYNGKMMASSMIGPGHPLGHALTSVNVPSPFSLHEDLLYNIPQKIIGNTKSVDYDYFNEATGTDSLQYFYSYAPFPVCPGQSLSVKAHYHYDVKDQCGNIVVSQDSTLGVNGIVSGPPSTFTGALSTFSADVAPYHVYKTLTVNTSDMQAALDSFLAAPPSCFLSENYFIRKSVESTKFPCPGDTMGPCAAKKLQLMQDLFPGAKYGKYTVSGGTVVGTSNSIFTIYFLLGHDVYRYQDTCTVPSLPDTMTVGGVTYHDLRTMPADSFIMVYNKAIGLGDYRIAEDLLPLHPEYCELMACFNDTFKTQMLAIPNQQVANSLHLLYLDSIIAHDPVMSVLTCPNPYDSLSTYRGGHQRLDSVILEQAYCSCSDSVMFLQCASQMFHNEIANRILINDNNVRNYYFSNIVNAYFLNRQRLIDAYINSRGDSCSHCAVRRMTLVPLPVFDPLITGTGAFAPDSIALSTYSTFSGTGSMSWLGGISTPADSVMDSTLTAIYDSSLATYHFGDSALCYGQIDTILARLSNCIAGDTVVAHNIRNTLDSLCAAHALVNGNYTPALIRYAITRNGIALSDLCNPYMVSYSTFPPISAPPTADCQPDSFYITAGKFLTHRAVLKSFASPGTRFLDTLHGSMFEMDVYNALSGGSGTNYIEMYASYNSSHKFLTLYVFNNPAIPGVPYSDTLKIFLRSPVYGNIFTSPGRFTVTTSCANSIAQPITTGFINEYSFVANVTDTAGTSVFTCSMLGWVDSIPTMSDGNNILAACIPCTQLKSLYAQFNDTLLSLGIVGVDHPCYDQMLQSFMNYSLGQQYSSDQYETFIQSCALGDSMVLPQYVGYSTFTFFDTTSMNAFIDSLDNVDTNYSFDDAYRDFDGSTTYTVCVDISQVPLWELWMYKNFFNGYSGTYVSKIVNMPLSTLQPPNELGFLYTSPTFPFTPADSAIFPAGDTVAFVPSVKWVWIAGSFVPQIFYNVLYTATAPPSRISVESFKLSDYIFSHGIPGAVFVPNFMHTVNYDYFRPKKVAYLQYTYGYENKPPYTVLDSVQAQYLLARIPSYTPGQASYTLPYDPNTVTNLYVSGPTGAYRLFDTLQYIINTVIDSNTVSPGHLFFDTNKVVVTATPDSPLIAYRCGDGTYWYRYFGSGDTLYNVFVAFPPYIPAYLRPSYQLITGSLTMPSIAMAVGDSNTRFFTLSLQRPGDTTIIQAMGLTTFTIGKNVKLGNVLLGGPVTGTPLTPPTDTFNNCERALLNSAIAQGVLNYDNYIDSIEGAITAAFEAYMMDSVHEGLILSYINDEFGYTLYNYDRAGNLITTVPPMGVSPLSGSALNAIDTQRAANSSSVTTPTYSKSNTYQYNTINQVVQQATINGGTTNYYYDAVARLLCSQNAKQAALGRYTYNIYDNLNRVTETGEVPLSSPSILSLPYTAIADTIRTHDRTDVVLTIYDTAATRLDTVSGLSAQTNLRKRVAAVKYFDTLKATDTALADYTYATHYSYDIQGNVKTLTHDFPELAALRQRYKRIDYDYDLISGKVNMLSYNRGFADQYYQRYSYDADNRITQVQTSADGYIWTQDAAYTYYKHGPLARIDLGDLRVQGIDYAYTIQGWLKVMNGDTLGTALDMGRDGTLSGPINARDAAAYTIDYFTNDYKPITAWRMQHIPADTQSLYNGNIARQTVVIDTFVALTKAYVYDQFNRIMNAGYYSVNAANGTIAGLNDYRNSYSYDLDGNITALVRYGNNKGSGALLMDSLTYQYAAPTTTTDKLASVYDNSPNNYTNDIANYPAGSPGPRYQYDPIGNTTKDLVSAQDTIDWNLYNKVTRTVNNADTSELDFVYDGAGNRVAKSYTKTTANGSTEKDDYYVHDAQGNVLAIYHAKETYDTGGHLVTQTYNLAEHDIYGSSRLGVKEYYPTQVGGSWDFGEIWESDTLRLFVRDPWYSLEYQDVIKYDSITPYGSTYVDTEYAQHSIGQKQYELTDHLGNVLATVSDQRLGATFVAVDSPLTVDSPANITTYKPITITAHDYYPFGEYMPGRYAVDDSTHCFTTSLWEYAFDHWLVYKDFVIDSTCTTCNPRVWTGALGYWFYYSDGVMWKMWDVTEAMFDVRNVRMHVPNIMTFHVTSPSFPVPFVGGMGYTLYDSLGPIGYDTSWDIDTNGDYSIIFNPRSSYVTLLFHGTPPGDTTIFLFVDSVRVRYDSLIPGTVVSTVCDEEHYHYGYNGKLKDNEWAGLGNSNDFGARMEDSRIGRFRSIDPLAAKNPSESPYAYAGNSPIAYVDKEGLFRMTPNDCNKYPELCRYLKDKEHGILQVLKNSRVLQLLMDYGNCSRQTLVDAFTPGGKSPYIHPVSMPSRGDFVKFGEWISSKNEIDIASSFFDYYKEASDDEDRIAALYCIIYGIEHEVSHRNDGLTVDNMGNSLNSSRIDEKLNAELNDIMDMAQSHEARFQNSCRELKRLGKPEGVEVPEPANTTTGTPTNGGGDILHNATWNPTKKDHKNTAKKEKQTHRDQKKHDRNNANTKF